MRYTYSIGEEDYMSYMFYSTSKSKRIQKRRALNKLILMVMYILTGMFLYSRNGPIASAVFYVLCIPLYFLYNTFERKQYVKHFRRFIADHFKENLGRTNSIEFAENSFRVMDEEDITYAYEDIEQISETATIVIIRLKSGVEIILPKASIQGESDFPGKLHQLAESKQITYLRELEWKWK